MNDQSFFDMAMKVIARQATDAERADFGALLAQEPELRAEFERLETDVRVAKDALPFIAACTASTGELAAPLISGRKFAQLNSTKVSSAFNG